jgi:hypothetical protein
VLYLMPYGSTRSENLEFFMNELGFWPYDRGPLFVFYDQEPILGEFNFELFDHIRDKFYHGKNFILVTTERDSETLAILQERYNCPVIYYFHHVFVAHDWFRGVKFDTRLIDPSKRKLKKKYISFNRLTSGKRIYRSLFISQLIEKNILDQGYVSYNDVCPDNGKQYTQNLLDAADDKLITEVMAIQTIDHINQANLPLRIDYKNEKLIPNSSFLLSAVPESQASFVYVVTETCYWEKKCHLTEKIFKPIVSRMPFILVGPAHNLEYLRSYGFKTFSNWFDESYDQIEDPIARMSMIGTVLSDVCTLSLHELECMLIEMKEVLDYNYNLFYSQNFIDRCWGELTLGLSDVCKNLPVVPGLREAIEMYL